MVNTRARKAQNVEFKTSGDATTVVIFGGSPVGAIVERADGEYDYTANDDRTIDGHFVTYDEARDFVKVALGSADGSESENGAEAPGIFTDPRKPRRASTPKNEAQAREAAKAKADREREREKAKKEREKAAEKKRKEREKLAATKKKEREAVAEQKKAEREKVAEEKKAAREAAKVVKLDGLVPTKMRGRGKYTSVAIAEIDDIDVGEPVTKDLVESVRVHGIIEPPIVRQLENGRYVPIAGRRRLQAARANGLTHVDAIVEGRDGAVVNDKITLLVENMARSENVIAQYKAVQALVDEGFSEKQIAMASGVETRQITKLRRLGRLHPRLIEATEDGLMSPWSADHVARKDKGEQEAVVRELEETGRVTTEFVKSLGKVKQDGAVGKLAERFKMNDILTDEDIEAVSRDTVETLPEDPAKRRQFAIGHLRFAHAGLVAAGEDGIAALVTSALESLEAVENLA